MYKKALIPAAGRGARLDRPNTPKPLVDVGGRAIIFHLLKRLEEVGVEHAVVVVGYEGKKIARQRSEEHTSELQSRPHLVCRLLLEKKKKTTHHPRLV